MQKSTKRERLARKIIRLQKVLDKWRKVYKTMPVFTD